MILIVGGGPVGLLTALRLARHGVPFQLIDKRLLPTSRSKASTFHPPILALLQACGLLEPLLTIGHRVTGLRWWEMQGYQPKGCRSLDLSALSSICPFPYRLHVEQQHLMQQIRQSLEAHWPNRVHSGVECLSCSQNGHGVTATVRYQHGQASLQADWLIGADGAASTVRGSLGLDFPGHDLPEPVVRLHCDTLPIHLPLDHANVHYFRRGTRTISALPMRNGWRLILRPEHADSTELLQSHQWQRQTLETFFARPIPATIAWHSDLYHVSERVASSQAVGRVLLAGDAAHVCNTRGGMNMNFGLLDGVQLADVLARWWHQQATEQQVHAVAQRRLDLARHQLLPRSWQLVMQPHPAVADDPSTGPHAEGGERERLVQLAMLDLV